LADIDDPFVGDDPGVKIKVDPKNEKQIPDEDCPEAFAKKKQAGITVFREIVREKIEKNVYQNEADDGGDDEKQTHQKYEPMPAQKKNHLFIVVLSRKIYFSKHIL